MLYTRSCGVCQYGGFQVRSQDGGSQQLRRKVSSLLGGTSGRLFSLDGFGSFPE